MIRPAHLLVALLLAALLALAGCGGDDDDGGGSVESFCQEFETADAAGNPLQDVEQNDVEGAKDALGEFEDTLSGLVDAAPDEIRADIEALRDYIAEYNEAIADLDEPADFQRASQDFQTENENPSEAVERLERFTEENCTVGGESTG